MIVIKGASGFGDSIYMRPIIEWFLKTKPDKYTILTNYPEVFYGLPINIENFNSRIKIDYHFTYVPHKRSNFTQFQDLIGHCNFHKIPIISNLKNRKPTEKTIIIPPYPPMGGVQTSLSMQPKLDEFMNFINKYKNLYFIKDKMPFQNLVNLFNSAKLVICQVGWAVPLSQILDVPLIIIFTKRALNSQRNFVATIKPHKFQENKITKSVIME